MILVKVPLRVSFFGGSSDIPSFYNTNEGMVLSTTIDQYMYIAACRTSIKGIKAVYNEIEVVQDVNQLKHDRIRNALKVFDINSNIEIASFSQIPTKGTGLGSSSSFTVGLIDALSTFSNNFSLNRYDVAELACDIEINMCGDPIGKQDQYAAAFGGFNTITFNKDEVLVTPVYVTGDLVSKLNDNLLMFYTGIRRDAAKVLGAQQKNNNDGSIKQMVQMAKDGYKLLKKGNIDDFGALLDHAWKLKRSLSSEVSNNFIDETYSEFLKQGALGGKVLGAGGGGYMLFYVPDNAKPQVRESAQKLGLEEFKFNFSSTGSAVTYAN